MRRLDAVIDAGLTQRRWVVERLRDGNEESAETGRAARVSIGVLIVAALFWATAWRTVFASARGGNSLRTVKQPSPGIRPRYEK